MECPQSVIEFHRQISIISMKNCRAHRRVCYMLRAWYILIKLSRHHQRFIQYSHEIITCIYNIGKFFICLSLSAVNDMLVAISCIHITNVTYRHVATPETNFTEGLWAHNPNLLKINNVLMQKTLPDQTGHNFPHVTTAEMSWNLPNCDLIGSLDQREQTDWWIGQWCGERSVSWSYHVWIGYTVKSLI